MPDFIRLPNGDQVRVPDGVPIEEAMAKVRTWYQSQQGQQQSQSTQLQAQPQAPMQQAQPQQPVQQPSLTPRTDEATRAVIARSLAGAGGGAIPVGVAMGESPAADFKMGSPQFQGLIPTAAQALLPGAGSTVSAAMAFADPNVARYGIPAGVAIAAPPLGALYTAGLMGATSGAGETIGQIGEVVRGEREAIDPGKIAYSTTVGATPFNVAAGASGPIKNAIGSAIKQSVISQALDALGRTFDTAWSEGRFPTTAEISKAALDPWTYLPAAVGGIAGGGAGFVGRGPRTLTEQEQIGAAGTEAAKRLEAVAGEGMAPLTAAQQTGRNLPGEFAAGTGELGAQQAVPGAVRQAVAAPAGAAGPAQREIAALAEAESQRLAGQVGGTQRAGEALVEAQLQTSIPGVARAGTTAENATTALNMIRNEADRLGKNVTAAYQALKNEISRLGGQTASYVPTNLQGAVDEVLSSLATVQRTKEIPSPIIGGTPTTITTAEPTALFDEATRLARNLKEVAKNPQNLDQIIGLRQQIDDAFSGITEIAPGFGKAQLTKLRNALKQDELAAARQLGGNAESLLKKAQSVAQQRFETLEANPIILKALRNPGERNAYQNSEQFFSEMAAQPEALDSIRKALTPAEFDQIRRGMFDSLRDIKPTTINGIAYEDASALANNFRKLPEATRETLAGSKALANDLQSVLDDASKAQSIGRTVPIREGINEGTLNELFTQAGAIKAPSLRASVMKDVNDAVARARRYENDITKQVRAGSLNPNIDQDEFVRNFVLSSKNPDVVRDALALLSPGARYGISKKSAEVFIDHIIGSSKTATSLDELIGDNNRLQILREVLTPNDLQLAKDLMSYQRAVLMTGPQGKLDSSELAKFVWKVTQARALTDFMVGNASMQNFIAQLSKKPDAIIAAIKPTVSAQAAGRGARAVGVPAELMTAYEEARESLPEDKRTAFDQAFPIRR